MGKVVAGIVDVEEAKKGDIVLEYKNGFDIRGHLFLKQN